MDPKEFDFYFPRGDTCPISFEITDKNGNELDMSKVELYFTMKRNYNTSNVIVQKRLSKNEIEVNGKIGSLIINHEDTANLPYGKYVYDIQFMCNEYVSTLAKGEIELTTESTHIINE